MCARKATRCIGFGVVLSLDACLVSIIILHCILYGWSEEYPSDVLIVITLLVSLPILCALIIPLSNLGVQYYRKNYRLKTYLAKKEKEFQQFHNWPIFVTMVCLLGGFLVFLFIKWDFTGNPMPLVSQLFTEKKLTLLALPSVMPLVYVLTKTSFNRAKHWYKKISLNA